MSENNKIGTYKFVAEPFHVDFTGRLTMGVLGNHLLNCAGFHATERGFGIATLNEDNYTWVLSRLAVELDEMPYQYEDFSIRTWVENVYRLFTDRNFAVLNKLGQATIAAESTFAVATNTTPTRGPKCALRGMRCVGKTLVLSYMRSGELGFFDLFRLGNLGDLVEHVVIAHANTNVGRQFLYIGLENRLQGSRRQLQIPGRQSRCAARR